MSRAVSPFSFFNYNTDMQAIILVAGEGKRMRPLTLVKPKPMLEVLGKPILAHIIDALPSQVDEVILVVGYKQEMVREHFHEQYAGRKITYVVQEKPTGTGMAIHLCRPYLKKGERFFVVFGDDLIGRKSFEDLLKHKRAVLVEEHHDPSRFGVVEADANGKVLGIEEKPKKPKSNLVVGPAYLLDETFFDFPMELHSNGEYYIPPVISQMVKHHEMHVERADAWHPIGYPHDIDSAEEKLMKKHEPLATSVVIICGGKGTRMPENEKHLPKVLVDVAGKPILQHMLENLKKQGVTDIVLALGHKAEMVIDWLKANGHADVRCAIEKELLGTGGAVKFAGKGISSPFIAMNGDTIVDINVRGLLRHAEGGYRVITGLELEDADGFGILECDENKKICAFKEKAASKVPGLINAGAYVLYPEDLASMPDSFSLEYDLFPKLVASGKLVVHHHKGNYWFDCGTPDRLKAVRDYFANKGK